MGASRDAVAGFKRSHPDHHAAFEEAGYYMQAFEPTDETVAFEEPRATSPLVGVYDSDRGELHVEHLPIGPSRLSEFKLSAEGGWGVTVACEKATRAYLQALNATKTRRKDRRHAPEPLEVEHYSELEHSGR